MQTRRDRNFKRNTGGKLTYWYTRKDARIIIGCLVHVCMQVCTERVKNDFSSYLWEVIFLITIYTFYRAFLLGISGTVNLNIYCSLCDW